MKTVKTFKSKRNRVSLLESEQGLLVEKIYTNSADAAGEIAIYGLLRGSALKTPRVIETKHDRILLSYLPGTDFVRVLEEQEQAQVDFRPWDKLADWLTAFRELTGLIMADGNLRNFLYDPLCGDVAGLDFEECRTGTVEEMFARLCAYMLLYDPPDTPGKHQIVQHIQDRCAEKKLCDISLLKERTAREVLTIQKRRRLR